jgi:hypothetical protein
MILAPTLTLNTLARGYDADATAFAAASGATDVAALSAFVKGVKELGLWSNMVCWPLRSSQNAGTGTTAFSLGGLGDLQWDADQWADLGADGITFTSGSSQTITVSSITITATDLILASCQTATSGNLRVIEYLADGGVTPGIWSGFGGSYYWDCRSTANTMNRLSGGAVPTSRIFTHGIASASGSTFFVNGTSTLTNAVSSTNANASNFTINKNGGNGNIAFVMFSQSITGNASLYSLYKSTLGTGLGLP